MEHVTPDKKQSQDAPKPVNWYSGWRGLATAAATVLGAKLIGILGILVAGFVFLWLQPKRGTGKALSIATVVGVVVAVVYSAVVLPSLDSSRASPITDRFGGVLVEPAK